MKRDYFREAHRIADGEIIAEVTDNHFNAIKDCVVYCKAQLKYYSERIEQARKLQRRLLKFKD